MAKETDRGAAHARVDPGWREGLNARRRRLNRVSFKDAKTLLTDKRLSREFSRKFFHKIKPIDLSRSARMATAGVDVGKLSARFASDAAERAQVLGGGTAERLAKLQEDMARFVEPKPLRDTITREPLFLSPPPNPVYELIGIMHEEHDKNEQRDEENREREAENKRRSDQQMRWIRLSVFISAAALAVAVGPTVADLIAAAVERIAQ